ncbi:hypothetical protein FB45DRAFT_821179, partial [Roridomyces roridus]
MHPPFSKTPFILGNHCRHETSGLSRDARFRNRSQHPVKYYLIDFDLSGIHNPSGVVECMPAGYGGTPWVPEFDEDPTKFVDPFAVDVWCLANLIRERFTEGQKGFHRKKRGFEFLNELLADMLNPEPAERPNMDEVLRRFSEIKANLSQPKLRSRFASVNENPVARVFKLTTHWTRQLYFICRG